MKKNDDNYKSVYSAPILTMLSLEGENLFVSSPVTWENNIVDPSWDTEGDYGLE